MTSTPGFIFDPVFLSMCFIIIASWWLCCLRGASSVKCSKFEDLPEHERRRLAFRQELIEAKTELFDLARAQHCAPLLLRLAWSDAAAFDPRREWPHCGGANGTVRTETELAHAANAGLGKAISYLAPLKKKFPRMSWADLIQMGGAVAVEVSGGPKIHMRYGRVDADPASIERVKSDQLPCPCYPFPDKAITPAIHVRNVFFRLGFDSEETVALMGGHTLGRAFKDRTGVCEHASGDQGATSYTRQNSVVRADGTSGVGMSGGQSWTKLWLQFDNSYFHRILHDKVDPELLWLPTDDALMENPEYRPAFLKFAKNQSAFFLAYAAAHKKMSELGSKFDPIDGIYLE